MSRVIKNNSPLTSPRTVGQAAALNVANFAEQAQKLIIEAQTKASQTIAQASARARELEKQAAERGYAEGLRQGLADGQADGAEKAFQEAMANFARQSASLQELLKACIRQIDDARAGLLQQARAELLELAIAIAEKVIHTQARRDVAVAQAALAKTIEMVSAGTNLQVRVCAAQFEQLREYAGKLLEELGRGESVAFVADEALAAGDVVLASRQGELDARVQTQIDNIVAALVGEAEGRT